MKPMKNRLVLRRPNKLSSLGVRLLTLLAAGCATVNQLEIPTHNVLMATPAGEAVDPSQSWTTPMKKEQSDAYFKAIIDCMHTFCEAQRALDKNSDKSCKILVFMHGGLNGRGTSLRRAKALTPLMLESGIYPLFVSWDSGFITSYRDHLGSVYKGIKEPKLWFAAPVQVVMDEGSSIAEAPAAWFADIRHYITPIERMSVNWQSALNSYTQLENAHCKQCKDSVDIGNPEDNLRADDPKKAQPHLGDDVRDDRTGPEKLLAKATFVPTIPTKIVATPFAIQALGRGAWDVMYRRTATLFTTEHEFNANGRGEVPSVPGISECEFRPNDDKQSDVEAKRKDVRSLLCEFTYKLEKAFIDPECGAAASRSHGCQRVQLSLVGHSMGSIVIDQWLRHAPNLEWRNIVYMAGATSVNDYRDTVYNYLEHQKERSACVRVDSDAMHCSDVYHLMLHPSAEYLESGWGDLTPRGSLLVWIDNYFSRPVTPLDRTVGRFFNLMPELARTPLDLQGQIHAKVFRVGAHCHGETDPQIHGDFSKFPFWDEKFWRPEILTSGPLRCRAIPGSQRVECPPNSRISASTMVKEHHDCYRDPS